MMGMAAMGLKTVTAPAAASGDAAASRLQAGARVLYLACPCTLTAVYSRTPARSTVIVRGRRHS